METNRFILSSAIRLKFAVVLLAFLFFGNSVVSARPGDLDSAFGSGGKVITPLGKFSRDFGYSMAVQPDGKIVVAGLIDDSGSPSGFGVARFNPDGSFDTSFGDAGRVRREIQLPFSNYANSVALQPDGKIVLGGFSEVSGRSFTLLRLNSDGSTDNNFGINGVVLTQIGFSSSYIQDVAIQTDGKIVAVGFHNASTDPNTTTRSSFAAARYNYDGTLDTTFDGDGKWFESTSFPENNKATSVEIQSDGKIVIGGALLVRLNPNGSLDNSFGIGGRIVTTGLSFINSLAIQSDGKIVAGGGSFSSSTNFDTAVARFNTDGSPDATFDGDGKVVTPVSNSSDAARSIVLQSDGKIVAAGFNNTGNAADFSIVRYNVNGSLDSSFDGDGIVVTAVGSSQDELYSVSVKSNGKITVAGFSFVSNYDFSLASYNADGSLDTSFGENGVAIRELGLSYDTARDIKIQSDGKIVASGSTFNGNFFDFSLSRYNDDGTLDSSFGTNGTVISSFGSSSFSLSSAIQPDGKIILAGERFITSSNRDFALARYNADGSLDASFGTGGMLTTNIENNNSDTAYSVLLQPDGKIIAVGSSLNPSTFRSQFAITRYNMDGSLDMTFDGDGKALFPVAGSDVAYTAALQPDGKIVMAGEGFSATSTNEFVLARLNPNGSLDTSFDNDGKIITPVGNDYDGARGLVIQPDGKIVAAGFASTPETNGSGYASFALVRYNSDGSLDTTFGIGGKTTTRIGADTSDGIYALVLQPDGKLLAGGASFSPNINVDSSDFAVVRYNTNGSLDLTFGTGGKVVTSITDNDDQIYSLALQNNGKLIAAGFSNGRDNSNVTIVRYLSVNSAPRAPFDFDGDGKSDISVYRMNTWYVQRSQAGFAGTQWGASGDLIAPADYDGDGKTDYAVFRPATGFWYILNSSNNQFVAVYFGKEGDLPRPGDFDGDGQADISVFRPSDGTWYRLNSSNNQFAALKFGQNGDLPLLADFDGDAKSDVAVFRQGFWYYLRSSDNQFKGVQFGTNGDKPAVGDFDGDGKSDISVFRPSTGGWYRINSSDNQFVALNFGVAEDVPTPADYDGDGRTDVSVFRPSNGTWYRINSANNAFYGEQFGVSADQPAPAAFNQ